MTRKILAILIDPHKREVRAVEDDFNNLDVLRAYLAQGGPGPLRAELGTGIPRIKFDHHAYCDDNGCFREGQAWFKFHGFDCPIPGYVLVLRSTFDGGEASADPELADMLPYAIQWMNADYARQNVPPVVVTTMGPEGIEQKRFPVDMSRTEPYKRAGE